RPQRRCTNSKNPFAIHHRMMRAKSKDVFITARDPKHLEWWLDKRIQRFVSPPMQSFSRLTNLKHPAQKWRTIPLQSKKWLVQSLAQRRPASHKMRQHLFDILALDPPSQRGLDTDLHQHPGRLLVRHEERV